MINNAFTFEGNIGRDPEMKSTKTGTDMVTSSVGVYRSKEQTDWFNLKAFGTAAKQLHEAKKGDKIQGFGNVNVSEYTDKNGNKQKSVDIMLNYCRVLPKMTGNVGDTKPASHAEDLPFAPPF